MGGIVKVVSAIQTEATKALGKPVEKEGPKELTSLAAVMTKALSDTKGFSDALEGIAKQGEVAEKSAKLVSDALSAALKSIAKSDFGLDPKKPEQKKALDAARKMVTTKLTSIAADIDRGVASLEKAGPAVAKAGKTSIA